MQFENSFRRIKEAVKHNKNENKIHSSFDDSIWNVYDKSIVEFGGTFYKSLPDDYTNSLDKKISIKEEELGMAFKNYIEDTLSKSKNQKLYAIEFGGPASNLFQGFKKGLFEKTAGVCLNDDRKPDTKAKDDSNSHYVLPGDLLDTKNPEMYKNISKELGSEKVDLIISRLMGPVRVLDKNAAILNSIIKKWYSMLNENGIIFAQFEYFLEHDEGMIKKYESMIEPEDLRETELHVQYWANEIRNKYKGLIDIKIGRGVIRLHKKEGAPEKLPDIESAFG